MEIKVSLSSMRFSAKPGKEVYAQLTASWINSINEPFDFMTHVLNGHPYCVQLKDGYRNTENFLAGQHISLDFDDGNRTPASFNADPFVLKYASFAYATLSSTEAEPRTRLVFVLDTPIFQAENMNRAYRAMMYLYGNADPKCKDASRFFYGAHPDGESAYYDRVLPLKKVIELITWFEDEMAAIEARRPVTREQQAQDTGNGKGLAIYWERRLLSTREGERNDTLNKAAYSLGQIVKLGRMTQSDAEGLLLYCGQQSGLEEEEVKRTIKSGFKAAFAK